MHTGMKELDLNFKNFFTRLIAIVMGLVTKKLKQPISRLDYRKRSLFTRSSHCS